MNLIKEMQITVSALGGDYQVHREAMMLQKLLKDAGVEDVVINNSYKKYHTERHDDELKLFVGAKPDKITINVEHRPWGG